MSTSGGGGYCDCGDKEAWKVEPFCGIHMEGPPTQADTKDPVDSLPADIRGRAGQVGACCHLGVLEQWGMLFLFVLW